MDAEEYVKQFFAVTRSGSLYRAAEPEKEGDFPVLEKLNGPPSIAFTPRPFIRVGVRLEYFEKKADPIMKDGRKEGFSSDIPNGYWETTEYGGSTAPIIGLFIRIDDALECLRCADRVILDPRFQEQTLETLRRIKIGNRDSCFRYPRQDSSKISYPYKR